MLLLSQPPGCTFVRTVAFGATPQLHIKENPMDVTRDIVLPLERDEAWEVVSDPEAWLVESSDLELVPGAEGTLVLRGGAERFAVVEEVSPGERLAFWWNDGEALSTRVELTLDDAVGGTRVTVVESGHAVGPTCSSAFPRMSAARAMAVA
jgi:uncharacterized protein YndB with AHSA1/START domain